MANKHYIGVGDKVEGMDIFDVVLRMDEVEPHIFEYEGRKYLKFSLAKRRNPDLRGRNYTAYIKEFEPKKEDPKPTKRKRRAKKEA